MMDNDNAPLTCDVGSLLKEFSKRRVLVVGDIMLDRFVYGQATRISPEGPVPVLKIMRESKMLGGAGNALANLAGLGVKADLIALTGDDEDAKEIEILLKNIGLSTKNLLKTPERPTAVKTRYLAGHQQILRTDCEQTHALPKSLEKEIILKTTALLEEKGAEAVDVLLLSDYGKSVLSDAVLKALIKAARRQHIPVLVDPKGTDYSRYKGASAVTPNKKELSESTGGMAVETDEQITAAALKLIKETGIEAVVATRGKDGMSIIQKNAPPVHIKGMDLEVFDVSGAGDTVIATIAAALAAEADLPQAAMLANIAGGVVVAKVGTAPIRARELLQAAEKQMLKSANLCDLREAVETAARWRARGLKIGFTNGCFDILHAGHVTYLAEARRHCDRLIVGLNHDASVRILKGPSRPVHEEKNRATVLAALSSVDMVVLFGAEKAGDDNTANTLIEALQPDIYFKGGDYAVEEIPETPTVRNHGGEVMVLSLVAGQSTTDSLEKLKTA